MSKLEPNVATADNFSLRLCAWTGPLAVLLSLLGLVVIGGYIPATNPDASGAEIARFYTDNLGSVRLGMIISMIGFTLFIPFGIGIAILRDRGTVPLFPRWLGFFNFWVALLILPALLLPFFKSGAFAYNGLLALYLPFGAFFIWMVVMTFGLMRAIGTQRRP
jgi:hypothetical protein